MRQEHQAHCDTLNDAELMRLLAAGDMPALGTIVERYQNLARILAFRILGRWDLADDVAQDAFLRLYRMADRYEPETALGALLRRIVVNLCLDWRKRKKPELRPEERLGNRAAEPAEAEAERSERQAAIWTEIAQLPERQRIALVLHRFEGLSHEEIAGMTGWSVPSVESLLVRAYSRLRERLRRWA